MKLSFDEINPIFNLSKSNINSIEKIESLLSKIKIDKKLKLVLERSHKLDLFILL